MIDSDKVMALYQLSLDKTFSRAAESLGISQPALSKKIARLEDELESNLVIRGPRRITLTEIGQEVLRYFKLKRDLDFELLDKLSSQEERRLIGEVNIATYSSIGRSVVLPTLAPLSREFSKFKGQFFNQGIEGTRRLSASRERPILSFLIIRLIATVLPTSK